MTLYKYIISLSLLLSISSASASWFEPTSPPPTGNISAPLNIGYMAQSKSGGLILGTGSPQASLIAGTAVGIGSLNTSVYRNMGIACGGCLTGGLDIAFSGYSTYPSTLTLGADQSGIITRTNNTNKAFWVSMPPYSLSNYYIATIGGLSYNGANELYIGGGSSNLTAANTIRFYTAPTQNKTYGTMAMQIGPATASSPNDIPGIVQFNNQIRISGGSPGAGKVLVSDATGLASWGNAGGSVSEHKTYYYSSGTGWTSRSISCSGTDCLLYEKVFTWTVPSGASNIEFQAWTRNEGGDGDSQSAYAFSSRALAPGTSCTITIGGVMRWPGHTTFLSSAPTKVSCGGSDIVYTSIDPRTGVSTGDRIYTSLTTPWGGLTNGKIIWGQNSFTDSGTVVIDWY